MHKKELQTEAGLNRGNDSMKKSDKIYFLLLLFCSNSLLWRELIPNLFREGGAEVFAQTRTTDSLLTLLKKDKEDTNKVNHLNALSWSLMYQNPDSSIILGNHALSIITPISSSEFSFAREGIEDNAIKKLRATTLDNLGCYYFLKTDYFNALDYYQKALKIDEDLKDKNGIAKRLGHIGMVYSHRGDYPRTLDYYFKALRIDEELNNKNRVGVHLGNIGVVYANQDDFPKALDYYFRAQKVYEELGLKNDIASNLGNIGSVYSDQRDFPKALDYFFKALKMAEELGNKNFKAVWLSSIGSVYAEQKEYDQALNYYFKALKMVDELGHREARTMILTNIGSLYTSIGNYKEAEQYLKKAIVLSDSLGTLNYLRQTEEFISRLYDTTRQYKLALIHYKKAVALKDTLFSQESKKELIRKEMNYEFDKKEVAIKAEHDKALAIAQAERKKQQIVIWSIACGLFLVVLFSGFIFRSLRITRKQKNIIELQKNEVSKQKEIVEKQKTKILDSITYAQRIQQSILMEESEIQNYLPESFIYYQPKDIVSGDFYWFTPLSDSPHKGEKAGEGYFVIAAVDCTGHGVPGAFMSMIGNLLLNQIVNEKQITQPSEILTQLNHGVYEVLHQRKTGISSEDGMDIALCTIDYKNNILQYAGAQNPLYVLSDGKIEVIKADVYGIGGSSMISKADNPLKNKYTNHVISLKKGMSIYLFSDGYIDQFGGSERKKFGSQKFKDLLLGIQHLNMQKQKEAIASAYKEWKGDIAQIDDILVMGIRI